MVDLSAGGDGRRLGTVLVPFLSRFDPPSWVTGPVVVGCSGGADSSALLALAVAAGLDVTAVHVDHGLRAGTRLEAEVVSESAERLGAGFASVSVRVPAGGNLEARARDARLEALEEQRARRGCAAVLLGHTGDDQAETVLLNLLRGSATAGLAAIPRERGRVVHPLLDLSRSDTVEVCARLGIAPVDDPMNEDAALRRVWVRREVIPLLERGAGGDLRARLARQAGVLRAEASLLDELADAELAHLGVRDGRDPLPVSVAALDEALALRAVRRWLTGPGAPPPSLAEVESTLVVARGARRAVELAGGVRVERVRGRLHRLLEPAGGADFSPVELPVPGEALAGSTRFEAWVERAPPVAWPDGTWTGVFDAEALGEAVTVRPNRPGDRVTPLGMSGSKKVTAVLAEAGVPPAAREGRPVVVDPRGNPVWLVGYRVGASGRVTPRTRRHLWIRAEPVGSAPEQGAGEV